LKSLKPDYFLPGFNGLDFRISGKEFGFLLSGQGGGETIGQRQFVKGFDLPGRLSQFLIRLYDIDWQSEQLGLDYHYLNEELGQSTKGG
jgi:hypothetical protein